MDKTSSVDICTTGLALSCLPLGLALVSHYFFEEHGGRRGVVAAASDRRDVAEDPAAKQKCDFSGAAQCSIQKS